MKQQQDFLQVTSHELNTPILIALTSLEEMLDDDDYTKENVQMAEKQMRRVSRILRTIFETEQIDLQHLKIDKKEVNLHSFIAEECEDFSLLVKKSQIEFKISVK